MSDKSFEEIWKKEIINSIMSNTDYVEWINVISQKYSEVCYSKNINWSQYYEGLSTSDKINIRNLCYFYEIIEKLYPLQYLSKYESEYDSWGSSDSHIKIYKIKYNDFSFKIEEIDHCIECNSVTHIKIYCFQKTVIKEGEKFIDFNDAMVLYKSKIANESTKEDIHVMEEKNVTEHIEVAEEKTDEVLEKETNNMENELNKKTSKNEKLKSKLALKKKILKEIKKQIELSKSLKKQLEECDREYKRLIEEYQNINTKENSNKQKRK